MTKKTDIVKFINTDTGDEYYYTIGKSKPINKKTAAGALIGVLGLVTAGIIVACRKHKSK